MTNVRGITQLGVLAVGLGIGAAVASTPGVAWADDFQISIDGMDLFPTAGNTASAYSGTGDIAIAYGDGATASAVGGTGDYAFASGSGANAAAGGLSTDTGQDNDTAVDIGNNAEVRDGAFAGDDDVNGDNGLLTGSGDTAVDIGNNTGFSDESLAIGGNDNYASYLGDQDEGVGGSIASFGNNDVAEIVGANSTAAAGEDVVNSNNDIAYVFDPFGTVGSVAESGYGGDYDLGAVFGDDLYSSSATGADYLYDIMSPAGDLPGSAAATSGGFLAELLSLFGL
jgi:hypothetical protein